MFETWRCPRAELTFIAPIVNFQPLGPADQNDKAPLLQLANQLSDADTPPAVDYSGLHAMIEYPGLLKGLIVWQQRKRSAGMS